MGNTDKVGQADVQQQFQQLLHATVQLLLDATCGQVNILKSEPEMASRGMLYLCMIEDLHAGAAAVQCHPLPAAHLLCHQQLSCSQWPAGSQS